MRLVFQPGQFSSLYQQLAADRLSQSANFSRGKAPATTRRTLHGRYVSRFRHPSRSSRLELISIAGGDCGLKTDARAQGEKKEEKEARGVKKKERRKKNANGFRTRKDTELFRAAILYTCESPAGSQGHRTPGLLSGGRKKKRKRKNGGAEGERREERKKRKNGRRDANIFASRRSQRGESVQKVSLRQRQVITYIHARRRRNSRWR